LSPLAFSLRFLQAQSDAQLAKLAGEGHERAFEALVRRYRKPLLAYCRRMATPDLGAEDTLQQGLLQAWTAIRTGVEIRDPRAWLYRIVHNVAVSEQRRPRAVPVELRETAATDGADRAAEQRMAAREALAGLAALPDMQREVMVGTAVDGMSHEEVADALGLSSGAVRGLIYRARATLRAAAAGGSTGLGGAILKGGAIAVTAGALATAGITDTDGIHRQRAAATAAGGVRDSVQHQVSARDPRPARAFVSESTAPRVVGYGRDRERRARTARAPRSARAIGTGAAARTWTTRPSPCPAATAPPGANGPSGDTMAGPRVPAAAKVRAVPSPAAAASRCSRPLRATAATTTAAARVTSRAARALRARAP
jgi:RNA polymerase sigma factor (sigma-70 family)